MAFWSSQTLESKVRDGKLICPAPQKRPDCNAYTLHIGPEIYVTPTLDEAPTSKHTKLQLTAGMPFTIPAGQFAFIMTEESVEVPTNAMAFISIKAKQFKFRGLVNVSGFHVDPGWKGPLIFAVFNAGPATIHLHRGQEMFLIWYASLDEPSELHKLQEGTSNIPSELIGNISGKLNSFENLAKIMREKDEELSKRIHDMEKTQTRITTTFLILGGIFLGVVGWSLREPVSSLIFSSPTTQSTPVAPNKPAAPPMETGATKPVTPKGPITPTK